MMMMIDSCLGAVDPCNCSSSSSSSSLPSAVAPRAVHGLMAHAAAFDNVIVTHAFSRQVGANEHCARIVPVCFVRRVWVRRQILILAAWQRADAFAWLVRPSPADRREIENI